MFANKWTSAITEKALEKTCQYSENPEDLKELFGNINLSPKPLEISYINTGIRKYFPEDKEERQTIEVKITRKGREITFPYGLSIYDTETISLFDLPYLFSGGMCKYRGKKYFSSNFGEADKLRKQVNADYQEIKNSMLYTILSCIRSEFSFSPIFEDFCLELGYDPDSRKAFSTWQDCLKISQKFQSIFTSEEVENFPS